MLFFVVLFAMLVAYIAYNLLRRSTPVPDSAAATADAVYFERAQERRRR